MTFFKTMLRDEAGATAIEYGLIAALVAVAAITALDNLGDELSTTFSTVDSKLESANT
ncbi:Flp family type IVb pilin [Alteraurantiacibacter buctensis]|uniref:Flp family type IVb pilin n=1 Tax=Alteraurantiacibacter buctensis TaxID=1503981 RepID=A0A844YUG2_9SPHN|nr:Flp family type IVb pilin [Alteraurantiacibacter buctensis]MXO70670.1 Flp family type IVb pilin [Alteraurantiacibacter buctensis]